MLLPAQVACVTALLRLLQTENVTPSRACLHQPEPRHDAIYAPPTPESYAAGFDKAGQVPPPSGSAQNITLTFSDIDLYGSVTVYDIWAGQTVGVFTGSYTAVNVPYHGTAFLRLTAA